MPLDNPRRIFVRSQRRTPGRILPWLVIVLSLAGASAAAGRIIANSTGPDVTVAGQATLRTANSVR